MTMTKKEKKKKIKNVFVREWPQDERARASEVLLQPHPIHIKIPAKEKFKKVLNKIKTTFLIYSRPPKLPLALQHWTCLFYGERGSGKTLEQSKEVIKVLEYYKWLYAKHPDLHHAVVFTNQRFTPEYEKKYSVYLYPNKKEIVIEGKIVLTTDFSNPVLNNPDGFLYYWDSASQLRYCPRRNCWRGNHRHGLHGAVVPMDDIATILPADEWATTPMWFRKLFTQGRHVGVHFFMNCQDPFSYSIHARRCTDMVWKFTKIFASRDTDETRPEIKHIFGLYVTRRIKAEWLWKFGDMTPEQIGEFKDAQKAQAIVSGKNHYRGIWKSKFHLIRRKYCEIYDTTQNVNEYRALGYEHTEYKCLDPKCEFKHVKHKLV